MKTNINFWSYLGQFFLEWEMLQTKVVEKAKYKFMFNNFFFRKSRRLGDVEKYSRAWQASDGNMVQAHCILDT